jgi:protein-disulfide isomerase
MKAGLDIIVTATLVVCAVVTTGLVARREFFSPAAPPFQAEQKPRQVNDWHMLLDRGVRIGPADAPVQLLEFADLECPFCASFHRDLNRLRARYPAEVALTYVHFPLPIHRFAKPAARVVECARDQARFEAMQDVLFAQQDAFGLKTWAEFAREAGVPDIPAFEACARKTEPVPAIVSGEALAKALDVQGTPTVIVNGWRLGRPPSAEELDAMVKAILAGKSPVTPNGKLARLPNRG